MGLELSWHTNELLGWDTTLTFKDVFVQDKNSLLKIVDGSEGASATDACTAVQDNFVVERDVGGSLWIKQLLLASFAPVVHPHVLDYCPQNLVVLLFWGAEVRPRQVLQLRHYAPTTDGSACILRCQLEPPFDQVGHEGLD